MPNKQTSYSSKEFFSFYSHNHVRLASIMQYCVLIIVLLTISTNFGVEAVYENAATFNGHIRSAHLRQGPDGALLSKNITNKNVTTLSAAKLDNIQVQAVYNAVEQKTLLNISWDKPLDWHHIHSYEFKIISNTDDPYCPIGIYQTTNKNTTLSHILLPPVLNINRYEIIPGCTYKISITIKRSDSKKNMTDIIYSTPDCVGNMCSCKPLLPKIKKFEAVEILPGRLNISWEIRNVNNKELNNITNVMFAYLPNDSKHNFQTIMQSSDCYPSSNYCIIDNTDLLEIKKQYILKGSFSDTYNCTISVYTDITVNATKSATDLKQATTIDMAADHLHNESISSSKNLKSGNENLELKQNFNETHSLPNKSSNLRNNASEDPSNKKVRNIKVAAIYSNTRSKIMLNITWDKPLDWQNLESYNFKLSPNSSDCIHELPFDTVNKDKTLSQILLPPPLVTHQIQPGCTYIVSIITNSKDSPKINSDVVFTVPDCVGKKCGCTKFSPRLKRFQVVEMYPGKFNISWEPDRMVPNITINNISTILLAYRPSVPETTGPQHFTNLPISSDAKRGTNYIILDDTQGLIANKSYEIEAIFKNIYNCKAYRHANITVTVVNNYTEANNNSSWVQVMLCLLLLFIVVIAILYLLRRNRLIIKEILRNPLSLKFSRRSRRAEARTSYIMVAPSTKRQQEMNLLYIDKEIIDGESDQYEFPRSRITFIHEIGKGAFGQVYLAQALGIAQQPGYTYVAVKTLREKAPPEEVDDFLSEIEILKRVREHPNIVRIFGCCVLKEPYLMVMEFVPCGDLKNYLLELRQKWRRKRTRNDSSPVFTDSSDGVYVLPDSPLSRKPSEGRPSVTETEYTTLDSDGFPTPTEPFNSKVERTLDHTELQNFALQIAKGMEHLEKIPIAHRDLAARNILINEYKTLKISDFGLSRVGPYVNNRTKKLPLRWVSLEAIEDHFFDSKGDVWSYAVVLWEIGTLGAFPYENIMDGMLLHYLQNGQRLPRPEICTDELYSLMLRCWSRDPQLRPSFQELVELLDVKKTRVYVDFNQLNPLYVFPPSKIPDYDKNSNLPLSDSTV